MPTVNFSPVFNGWQGFTPSGLPLSGGFLYTYQAGTSTPQPSYTTNIGNVANSNPIALQADGRPPQEIWLDSSFSYKFILTDALLNPIGTYDNITGIDNSVPPALSQWVVTGITPAFVNATTFTVAGDQRATFQVGRRVQYTLGSGNSTGSITASVFGALTTVTLVTDSIPLDGTLSAVNVGFLTGTQPSVPSQFFSPVSAPSVVTPLVTAVTETVSDHLSLTGSGGYLDVIGAASATPPAGLSYGLFRDAAGLALSSVADTEIWGAGVQWFGFTSTGGLYGTGLHMNAINFNGPAINAIGSGYATPIYIPGANVISVAGTSGKYVRYSRVGNVVAAGAYGGLSVTAGSGTLTVFTIPLPIASNFPSGLGRSLTGQASFDNGSSVTAGFVSGGGTPGIATVFFYAPTSGAYTFTANFLYEVL